MVGRIFCLNVTPKTLNNGVQYKGPPLVRQRRPRVKAPTKRPEFAFDVHSNITRHQSDPSLPLVYHVVHIAIPKQTALRTVNGEGEMDVSHNTPTILPSRRELFSVWVFLLGNHYSR